MVEKVATVQDVARVAGVSAATVSRALSRPTKVTEATRELVAEAVKQTGYRVNRAARNLRTRRTDSVLVLLPDLANPFFSSILEGIAEPLEKRGISMLVSGSERVKSGAEKLIDYFEDGRADGLLALDGTIGAPALTNIIDSPYSNRIVFACEWPEFGSFSGVRSENAEGAALAIRHLHTLGHRRIGYVAGPAENVLNRARRDGVTAELNKLGIPLNEKWDLPGDFSLEAGAQAANAWLSMSDRPTAIFCSSDILAIGLISELSRRGISVPDDLSVVGFDDIEIAERFIPSLTTIRQDRQKLGEVAGQMLVDQLSPDDVTSACQSVSIPVSLIERDSCAPISD